MTPALERYPPGHAFAPTHEHLWRAPDGARLAVYDWKAISPRGTVIVVHGLGEHALRYTHVAAWFVAHGYAVRAYDQFGHGHSDGARGGLDRRLQLCDHLAQLAAGTETHGRLLVFGHSMGGLVTASAVARDLLSPDLLLLSAPALAIDTLPWQRFALAVLPRLLPNLRLGNGLDAQYLSHDPAVVERYRKDPLVHDRISARLAAFIASEGDFVVQAASFWSIPTLLLYAGGDRLVAPRGSRAFSEVAPEDTVRTHCFADFHHEIFNEPDNALVFDALAAWLAANQK